MNSDESDGKLTLSFSECPFIVDAVQIRTGLLKKINDFCPEEFCVEMTAGALTLDTLGLDAVLDQAEGSTVRFTLKPTEDGKLSQNQIQAISYISNVVSVVDSVVSSGEKIITDLKNGHVYISLSPELFGGRQNAVSVMDLSEDGLMTNVDIQKKDGKIIFSSDKLSRFVSTAKA